MRATTSLLALAGGALLSVTLPPYGLWPLQVALIPLFVLVATSRHPREAFRLGFLFALPFFTLHIMWLPLSFSTPEFFGPGFWLLYPPLLLLLSSFWGLVTWLARLLGGRGTPTLALLPPLWILMEWARTQGYFAFPWGTLGYAWLDTPVAQVADSVGVWGLGLLTTTSVALLSLPFVLSGAKPELAVLSASRPRRRPIRPLAPLLGLSLLAAAWFVGDQRLDLPRPEPQYTALLVQGDLDPFGRLTAVGEEVEIQARLTEQGRAELPGPPDLVVWPEGAVLQGFAGAGGGRRLALVQGSSPQSAFLVGARTQEGLTSYNSAFTIDDGAMLDRYDKRYLVPFGERFPLADSLAPLYRAVFGLFGLAPLASTSAGTEIEPLDSPLGELGVYICYESVFPQVQRRLAAQGASVLVNITNDAWFSRGVGAEQHYAMGAMRAIETRRYLIRAGIDGITALVDPFGRTVESLPRGRPGYLAVEFGTSDEITPWVRFGWLLVPVLAAWALVVSAWRYLRGRQ